MPCYPIYDEKKDEISGWMCGENLNLPVCADCGLICEYLCDFPVGKNSTCDKKICPRCALEIKNDIHLCPEHAIYYKDNSDSLYLQREIKKRYELNISADR